MRIRDRVGVRVQRRAERRHESVVEFHGFAGPVRCLVVYGGGTEAVPKGVKLPESDGRSKTGRYSGHGSGER